MPMSEALIPEFDQEMANTRRALERVPDDKFDWKPHQKSMSMGRLASHIANLPGWASLLVEKDSLDIAPGGVPMRNQEAASSQELLGFFDQEVKAARAAIAAASDERLRGSWTLLKNGRTVFTLPRITLLGSMVLKHIVHHRGQLTVYLRLNDIPVPGFYGPSADEQAGTG